uniref:Uncharacterized protein n=1 Tax=Meloidogyne enterolobii TaxID=390850 RepID=A0A6V7XWI3_MELEN|nr:unnamed protein product [Meloidogyne enterolobii]CAD2203674.1 unnamed protein product [Meloidogyne enterolobii]
MPPSPPISQQHKIFNVLENGITQLGLVDTHLDQRGYPNLDDHEDQLMVINAQLDYIFGEAFTVSLSSAGLRKKMNTFLARWDEIIIEESYTLDERAAIRSKIAILVETFTYFRANRGLVVGQGILITQQSDAFEDRIRQLDIYTR